MNANFPSSIKLEKKEDKVKVTPLNESKSAKASWGMARTLVNNMVRGVSQGFSRILEINGVGYRASIDGDILTLQLGYSHDIKLAVPSDLRSKVY